MSNPGIARISAAVPSSDRPERCWTERLRKPARHDVYLTNVVKHFNWEARGKRRIHRKPNLSHIRACRPWLDAEIGVVDPQVLVLLGATAAQSLLGRDFRVTGHRGEIADSSLAPLVMATVHPSSILRARDSAARHAELEAFVRDLRVVAGAMRR